MSHWNNVELLNPNNEDIHNLTVLPALRWEHNIYFWRFWKHMCSSDSPHIVQVSKPTHRRFPPKGFVLCLSLHPWSHSWVSWVPLFLILCIGEIIQYSYFYGWPSSRSSPQLTEMAVCFLRPSVCFASVCCGSRPLSFKLSTPQLCGSAAVRVQRALKTCLVYVSACLPACKSVCHMLPWFFQRSEEGVRSPGIEVCGRLQPPCGWWELYLGSLEQPVFLTKSSSLDKIISNRLVDS